MKFKKEDVLIPIEVAGIQFKNPFYVSSGPATSTLKQLTKIEKCGWAAASIKLTFDPFPYINLSSRYSYWSDRNALGFTAETRLNVDEGLKLVNDAKRNLKELKLFANITYVGEKGIDGWVDMSRKFEEAGSDVIELNMCCPNMSFNIELSGEEKEAGLLTGASLGQDVLALTKIIKAVKREINVPLFVKLTPEGGKIGPIAKECYKAGADSVGSAANRLAIPLIDVYHPTKSTIHLQEEPSMACHTGAWLKPLALRDTYEIRKNVGKEYRIHATGGMRNTRDVIEMIMCGADLIGFCTEILISGYDFIELICFELKKYMNDMRYKSTLDFRDIIVDSITSSDKLTIYPGYAEIKNPYLSAPCQFACPISVPVQSYVRMVAEGNFKEAYQQIVSRNPLQSILRRICTHPCETACTRKEKDEKIAIRDIKRFVIEYAKKKGWKPEIVKSPSKNIKVAVIGSGPAGLSVAHDLARAGYDVEIFESQKELGGMLRYGIQDFRLPKTELDEEIKYIKDLGVKMKTDVTIGKDITLRELRDQGFKAIFFGIGAKSGLKLGIPGEDSKGCYSAIDFLSECANGRNPKIGNRVAVIGGGFTAIDSARTAVRLGAKEVFILYRRTKDEMPAAPEDIEEAEEEGVKIMYLVSPKYIVSKDGKVSAIKMINHVLGEKDLDNRRKPLEVEGTEFTFKVDTIITALGQKVEFEDNSFTLEKTETGSIKYDEKTGKTNIDFIFVGGDAATGPDNIVNAIASGKKAAVSIDKYLSGENAILECDPILTVVDKDLVLQRTGTMPRNNRTSSKLLPPEKRKYNFEDYTSVLSEEEVIKEAQRCLTCGCGIGCGKCEDVCCHFAVNRDKSIFSINKEECKACGMCYYLCPNSNITIIQKEGNTA